MKVGLLVRGEDRGLGIQTWEAYRHLRPDRTLLVHMGELGRGFPVHADRFPDAVVAPFDGHRFDETQVRDWMRGLDVVLSCETLYDWRIAEWGRELGVATVVQVNPEFYKHGRDRTEPHPTVWWNPTPWRMETLPAGAREVGVPVAVDRFTNRGTRSDGPVRFLHVAGRRALGDRNGTTILYRALRHTTVPIEVRVVTQESRLPHFDGPRHVRVSGVLGGVEDYWSLYDGADVLVLPRRYGGLCLPVQEGCAAGLAVVLPDCSPNEIWPAASVRTYQHGNLAVPAGDVPLYDCDVRALAVRIDQLAEDATILRTCQSAGLRWAETHSWAAMLDLYRSELDYAANRASIPAA